jgi:adenosine kinase
VRILISGSMAFDSIMVFQDHFRNHILPDKVHMLNVAFLVPQLRREYGGCAGNIAYNLSLLQAEPVILATVGDDFSPYAKRCEDIGLSQEGIRVVPGCFTGQAFITTDLDDNQITAFHPGAMSFSHYNHVRDVQEVSLGIVAPAGKEGMLQHAHEFFEAGIPFIFDPGQGLPMFSGDELLEIMSRADYMALNDYEAALMCEKTGLSLDVLARRVSALIVTRGAAGSEIHASGAVYQIEAAPVSAVVDPTGCGDAYRAGLLYGLTRGWDWQTTGRLASVLGAIKIEHRGGQNHFFTLDQLRQRFVAAFGMQLPL